MSNGRYSEIYVINPWECDTEDKLKYSSLFSFMQDTASSQCDGLGFGRERLVADFGVCYVIVRMNVRMRRIPLSGEKITVYTWPENRVRPVFHRYFTFTDEAGEELGSAVSQWVLMNLDTRRIVNPSSVGLAMPDTSMWEAPFRLDKFVPSDSGTAAVSHRIPVCTDFDSNGHVNNARYLDWVSDAVPGHMKNIMNIDIQYKNEIRRNYENAAEISAWVQKDGFCVTIKSDDVINIECNGTEINA